MFEFNYAELWGTVGSVVILLSMCFNAEKPLGSLLLRILNWAGCVIYIYYGVLITSISVVILNSILLVVNTVYLVKVFFNRKKNSKKKDKKDEEDS